MERYMGVQVGFYRFDHPDGASMGYAAAPHGGLRVPFDPRNGVYVDASFLVTGEGPLPTIGAGLYFNLRTP
jgi:hypothetical protein